MGTLNMKTATTIFNWLIRITGLFQLIIGVIFWVNQDDNLVPVHTLVGVILVLSLWIMAFLAARAGVNWKMTALAFVSGFGCCDPRAYANPDFARESFTG